MWERDARPALSRTNECAQPKRGSGGSRMIHKEKKKKEEGEGVVTPLSILSIRSFFLSLTDRERKLRHGAVAEIIARKWDKFPR